MNIKTSTENRVLTITLDRPEARNAMTREMWESLLSTLEDAQHDEDIGCVVLTGADPAFCAGGDVKAFAERLTDDNPAPVNEDSRRIRRIMESSRILHEMPKPTIAAVNGACAGAGFALAMACDIRLASVEAKFTTAFANVGLSGDFGGSWFLSKIVGTAKARELYYFATAFDGRIAEEMGVANKSYLPEDLMGAVKDWAEQLANGPGVAIGYMKRNMNLAEHAPLSQALDQEALHMTLSFRTEDHREAAQAFVEKRKPKFNSK